jgi:formylglycine-generating enzyme required for sulfatase activity
MVSLSGFQMLETEVTQAQYESVIGTDPSCKYGGASGATMPVECVDWSQARTFCQTIGGRLPTEAEWEYAARGGKGTPFYCGPAYLCLDGIAWFQGNSDGTKQPVKGKLPNAFGLYDMLGNVWEWTNDWYWAYGEDAQTNPQGPVTGADRVMRGGAFIQIGSVVGLRVSSRSAVIPQLRDYAHGFRCVRDAP